ncbi:MAG TPA: type II toxin-antitoxin system PemK/MazF family toxin [Gemmataceae bacterium]|jgi:mRNA interferase MazF|nr:type II toxin-antitoxin system PemK/MazF family toxin [Gemmataceae bacterium]
MSYQRGDIVLASLPFSDASGTKVRPALVVQCDRNNQRLDDVILALITRVTHRASIEPTQLLIDITTPEGKQSGLLHTSAVKCEHLITLHRRLIQRVIGSLPATAMQQINTCLKVSLDLP